MPILAIITFIIFIIINKQGTKKEEIVGSKESNYAQEGVEQKESNHVQEVVEQIEENTKEKWTIEIPSIALMANISEGTEEETLISYVGHFSSTPRKEGNIGLAAHNRGYPINYFSNLKNVNKGDEIIYTYGEWTKTYIVEKNIKISDIDWSYLENTNENQITLITCIENEPAYRRCVQAVEKEEE